MSVPCPEYSRENKKGLKGYSQNIWRKTHLRNYGFLNNIPTVRDGISLYEFPVSEDSEAPQTIQPSPVPLSCPLYLNAVAKKTLHSLAIQIEKSSTELVASSLQVSCHSSLRQYAWQWGRKGINNLTQIVNPIIYGSNLPHMIYPLRNSDITIMGITKCSVIAFAACCCKCGERPMVSEFIGLAIELTFEGFNFG